MKCSHKMSLNAKTLTSSLSSSPSFAVTGKSLQLQLSRPLPQLPTRKIYNPTYFFNETYQHEIANHYRDYKRRSRIPRRSKRNATIYVPYRRAAFYGVVSGEKRPVLPIAVHDFPRFTAVYTTLRGRQTLCEDAPPDTTYNATVRRIRQAKSYKELKVLVERQLRWSEHHKRNTTTTSSGRVKVVNRRQKKLAVEVEHFSRKADKWGIVGESKSETSAKQQTNNGIDVNVAVGNANEKWYDCNDVEDDINANDSVEKIKANFLRLSLNKLKEKDKQQAERKQFKARQAPTNTLESVWYKETHRTPRERLCSTAACCERPTTGNYKTSKQQLSEVEQNFLNSTEYYLQLASEYYEQGFLRTINYLQTIGKRNVARRHQLELAAKRATPQATSNSSNGSADESASPTTSATNTPRLLSAENYLHLTYLLQRIGRKRSFKLGLRRKAVQQSAARSSLILNTASVAKSPCLNSCTIRVKIKSNAGQASKAARRLHDCSMHDYLNANTPTTISTTNIVEHNTISNAVATHTNFHELIDHLMQLEISDIDASLPKITLTDCSNHGYSVDERAVGPYTTTATTTTTTQTNDNAFAFEFNTTYNSNNFSAYNALHSPQNEQQQQQVPQQGQTTALRNGFTLRETKFGAGGLHSSLELPDDVYYNSEARPP